MRRYESLGGWTRAPEFNVAVFAILLNLAWELARIRAYAGLPTLSHARWRRAVHAGGRW